MNIKDDSVSIVEFSQEDISSKIIIINNPLNNKFLHYDLPLTFDKTLKWFKNKDNTKRIDCTIKYNNQICGFCGLLNIDNKNKKAEYYICIDNEFSGKGIGTKSSKIFLEYAINKYDLNKIYLFTEVDNVNAQHLFEKVGFVKEGKLVDDLIVNNRKVSRFAYGMYK